jgi:hypothetical protein
MAREDARRCKRCDYAWYAQPIVVSGLKPRWFDENAVWTDGQARMARRASNYEQAMAQKNRWARCPNCGSTEVKTVTSRNFEPTGAMRLPSVPIPPAPPTVTTAARARPRPPDSSQHSARSLAVRCTCGATVPVGQKFCGECAAAMPEVVVVDAPSTSAPSLGSASDFTSSRDQPAWQVYEESLAAAKAAGDRGRARDIRAAERQRLSALSFKETMAEARAKTRENMRKAREQRGT